MIRILIAEDEPLLRSGLRALAERDGDITVVGEADNGGTAITLTREHRPDIVLMDLRMPGVDGVTATEHIVTDPALRNTRVVVLTTFDEEESVLDAIRAGAAGYLLKDIKPDELRRAIRTVTAGHALLSPAITSTVMNAVGTVTHRSNPALVQALSPRERDVLTEIGRGLSNQEIAVALFISPDTARTYVSRLLSKTGSRDRAQLVILAYESGLLDQH